MAAQRFLILGAGFTGRRVARRLEQRGHTVTALSGRDGSCESMTGLERVRVLYSIPPSEGEADRFRALEGCAGRVVYLSSTGVYGETFEVDEKTAPAPGTERARARMAAEERALNGPWSAMVLRPAAIYGPGRGVHESLLRGEFQLLGDGSNFVSRIHVDDLAAICEAALLADIGGAWPVADEHPCTSLEICEFCCALLGLPMPAAASREQLTETRRANRKVDGRAVCRALHTVLQYPSYRAGIPACLANIG